MVELFKECYTRSNGHFTTGKEWRLSEERLNEINISAEHLDRPIENIMATMCHEMVHYYCQLNGIKDVSSNGRYHNKLFKEEAEKRGLSISCAQYIGWSVTDPSEEFISFIHEVGIEKPLDINRDGYIDVAAMIGLLGGMSGVDGTMPGIEIPKKPKSSTRNWYCPSCGAKLRTTKDLNIICGDCMVNFVKKE